MLSGVLKANSLAFLLWHQQGFFFSFFPQRVLQPAWHQQPRHDSQTSYLKRKTCTFWNILNSIFCFIRPTMPESLLSVEATSTSIYGADFFSSFDRKCCQRCRCVCWNPLHAVCEVTELKHCLTFSDLHLQVMKSRILATAHRKPWIWPSLTGWRSSWAQINQEVESY